MDLRDPFVRDEDDADLGQIRQRSELSLLEFQALDQRPCRKLAQRLQVDSHGALPIDYRYRHLVS
jgi:hypothetical protein